MGWDPRSWGVRLPPEHTSASSGAASSQPPPAQRPEATKLPPAPDIAALQAPNAAATQPPSIAPASADGSPPKPPLPSTSTSKSVEEQYREFKAIMGLGLMIMCPVLMVMPPRRLNVITALQAGMFGWGANEQTSWRTGNDLLWHYNRFVTGGKDTKKQ